LQHGRLPILRKCEQASPQGCIADVTGIFE